MDEKEAMAMITSRQLAEIRHQEAHFKLTFSLIVLSISIKVSYFMFFHTVESRSNGPAINKIPPKMDANSEFLHIISLFILHWLEQNSVCNR